MTAESLAREEICRVGKSLFDRGYAHGTAGNISVRLDGAFLITPTDACLGNLEPERIAKVNSRGDQLNGDKASKTLALHRRIYDSCDSIEFGKQAQAIIHTHSSNCVALSLGSSAPELLPPVTPYFVMKVGHVPLVPYYAPGTAMAADAVAKAISEYAEKGTPIRAIMLSRLGPNVWHESLAKAMATLEELEETAKLMRLAPQTKSLPRESLDELTHLFGARW